MRILHTVSIINHALLLEILLVFLMKLFSFFSCLSSSFLSILPWLGLFSSFKCQYFSRLSVLEDLLLLNMIPKDLIKIHGFNNLLYAKLPEFKCIQLRTRLDLTAGYPTCILSNLDNNIFIPQISHSLFIQVTWNQYSQVDNTGIILDLLHLIYPHSISHQLLKICLYPSRIRPFMALPRVSALEHVFS